jgi:HAD superfamily hydrolase (TIGR01509 family)
MRDCSARARVHFVRMTQVVLLDIDGTLVDSNQLHAESWCEALAKFGIHKDVGLLRSMIGMGSDKLLPEATGIEKDSELGGKINDYRGDLFMRAYLPRVQAIQGARALVERILARGLKPVVASSANTRELEGLLAKAGVDDLLPLRTGSDDAAHSKPDPDVVLAALKRAEARPEDAVLVGDTPYDLRAAQRAGVGFIGVRTGGYEDAQLRGALAVYRDVAELSERLDESPLAR